MDTTYSNGAIDQLLEKSLLDIQEVMENKDASIEEKVSRVTQGQYYLLLFTINDRKINKTRSERIRSWWEKFEWLLIPIILAAFIAFVGQFLYFWFDLVPILEAHVR